MGQIGQLIQMKTIKQTYKINAPINKVWDALVDSKFIDKWGGGPAKMSQDEGAEFSLWGGDIYGKNTKVVKYKELSQEWYGGKWEKPSILSFHLSEKDGRTIIKLAQKEVPEKEIEKISEGWKDYYLGPLKELVESL